MQWKRRRSGARRRRPPGSAASPYRCTACSASHVRNWLRIHPGSWRSPCDRCWGSRWKPQGCAPPPRPGSRPSAGAREGPPIPRSCSARCRRWTGSRDRRALPCADPEILFSALSSLVEVVKALTPSTGRVYANLGHEAVVPPDGDADDGVGDTGDGGGNTGNGGGHAVNGVANAVNGVAIIGNARAAADGDVGEAPAMPAAAPRSEVVIELVSTAASAYASLPAAVRGELGSLAFELAVVAAIVESKGGEFYVGSPAGDARSYVVRLPVQPGSAARGAG